MNLKPLLILPPLAIGILGFMAMNRAEAPPVETREESRLTVRVTPVEAGPLDVTATGYGRVEAVRNWTAVSQVAGRVIDGLDDLSEGALVDEGTVVLQIDPTDYELAVQKAQANIAAAQAALAELDRMEENSLRLLELEQDILDVAQAEYDRVKGLVDRGSNAVSSLDTAQKTLLAQENAVASITNTLALFPAQRASAEATLAVRQAELAEAERALENTTITAPFRGRISESSVEIGQYVSTGETLLSISGIDAAEIVASFPTSSFGAVALVSIGQTLQDVAEVDSSGIISFLTAAGVTATVQMDIADFSASWDAELVRFRGTIDSDTGHRRLCRPGGGSAGRQQPGPPPAAEHRQLRQRHAARAGACRHHRHSPRRAAL